MGTIQELIAEFATGGYGVIGMYKGSTLVHDGGLTSALSNATLSGSPTLVDGDCFDEVATSLNYGGDARQCNGTSSAIVFQKEIVQAMLTAQAGTIMTLQKRNNTVLNLARQNSGYELSGTASSAGSHNALYLSCVCRATIFAPQPFMSFIMTNAAATAVGAEVSNGSLGENTDWHFLGGAFSVAQSKLWCIAGGVLSASSTISSGSLPASAAHNRFVLGGYNNDAGGSSIQYACPYTYDITIFANVAWTQTQISRITTLINGKRKKKVYANGRSGLNGAAACAALVAATMAGGTEFVDEGDSNNFRTNTNQVPNASALQFSNSVPSRYNREGGNVVARARTLIRLCGQGLSAYHVGANTPGGQADAFYLGCYNATIATANTATDTHVLGRDINKWNTDYSAGYLGAGGWYLDLAYKASGTQSDAATSGLTLDPTSQDWPFDPYDNIKVVVRYATFASGGGTIYPEVIKVADSSVVVAAQTVPCTGSNGWSTITINIGRITEPVRLRLQGASALTAKVAIGHYTILASNRPGKAHYSTMWGFGGQDLQLKVRSMVEEPAQLSRLIEILKTNREVTGAQNICFVGQWRQNARNLQFSIAISNISAATPAVVTANSHGLTSGTPVTITDTTTTPSVNLVDYYAKVITSNTVELYTDKAMTIPVAVSSGGATTGYLQSPVNLAYTEALARSATYSNIRAGHRLNLLANRSLQRQAALAAGYSAANIWFWYPEYWQVVSTDGGDYVMEQQLMRAYQEIAADDTTGHTIVADEIEMGLTYQRLFDEFGFSYGNDTSHATLANHRLRGNWAAAVMSSGVPSDPSAGGGSGSPLPANRRAATLPSPSKNKFSR